MVVDDGMVSIGRSALPGQSPRSPEPGVLSDIPELHMSQSHPAVMSSGESWTVTNQLQDQSTSQKMYPKNGTAQLIKGVLLNNFYK
jgi:hypothetical protein